MRPLRLLLGLSFFAAAGAGCKGVALGPPKILDTVQISVTSSGFSPDVIYAKRGKPLTMVFNRTEEHTCATEVVIAQQNIRRELPLNAQVPIVFMPEKVGDVKFACPMNMVVGTVKVVN